MSLIQLEDVLHRIYSEPNTSDKLYQDINSLPQYNPEYGWIPVTERLPEEGCYLVFADDIMYVTATGNDGIFWNAGEIVSGVTHWMNLPNPPKQ